MSTIIRWLSPLIFRLISRYGARVSGLNQERLRETRNRLVGAVLYGILGFFALVMGLFTVIIDSAVQFEQHGGIDYNVVMMIATGLGVFGVAGLVIAKMRLPSFDDFRAVARKDDQKGANLTKRPRRPEYAH